jgi:hypothetical protein
VENDLRKQLQEEREAASKIRNKLETDLKRVSGHLQAEKDRFIAELRAERETSAKVRLELGNIVREAAGNIRSLRTENKRLLSELQTAETKDRSLCVFIITTIFQCTFSSNVASRTVNDFDVFLASHLLIQLLEHGQFL